MKSSLTFCLAGLLLAGCASPEYWDHGEWLDHVSVRPQPAASHTPEEMRALRAEADQLHARAEAVRNQMAFEKSRDRRIDQLKQLQEIGDEARPVEEALQGGPMPYRGLPTQQPGEGGGDGG